MTPEWECEECDDVDLPDLQVDVVPREIVGRLLGPDGSTVAIAADRPWVPFGFRGSAT